VVERKERDLFTPAGCSPPLPRICQTAENSDLTSRLGKFSPLLLATKYFCYWGINGPLMAAPLEELFLAASLP
jgi:hypothetical protein